jgi:hypothetical protein
VALVRGGGASSQESLRSDRDRDAAHRTDQPGQAAARSAVGSGPYDQHRAARGRPWRIHPGGHSQEIRIQRRAVEDWARTATVSGLLSCLLTALVQGCMKNWRRDSDRFRANPEVGVVCARDVGGRP